MRETEIYLLKRKMFPIMPLRKEILCEKETISKKRLFETTAVAYINNDSVIFTHVVFTRLLYEQCLYSNLL